MTETIDIKVEYAIQLAQEYLAGHWLKSTSESVSLKTISGGYCSRLYLCEDLTGKSDPSKFLIRVNGGKALEEDDPFKLYNQGTESIVFFMHGHLGYGPQLYGVINNGRLEEYIPSRTLTDKDLQDREIRMQIARKLARFHSMKLPVPKKPFPSLELLLSTFKLFDNPIERQKLLELSERCDVDLSWERKLDFKAQIHWVEGMLRKVGGRLVLSTNDMNKNNCLIRDTPDKFGEIVTLVDYEIGGTNWRGYDIATHFVCWMIDHRKPDFLSGIDYPDIEIRREFISEYLKQTQAMNVYDDFDADGLDSCDHVLMEADLMAFVVMLFVVCFDLKQKKEPNIFYTDMKHLFTYHTAMVNFYFERKQRFLEDYGAKLDSMSAQLGGDLEFLNRI